MFLKNKYIDDSTTAEELVGSLTATPKKFKRISLFLINEDKREIGVATVDQENNLKYLTATNIVKKGILDMDLLSRVVRFLAINNFYETLITVKPFKLKELKEGVNYQFFEDSVITAKITKETIRDFYKLVAPTEDTERYTEETMKIFDDEHMKKAKSVKLGAPMLRIKAS